MRRHKSTSSSNMKKYIKSPEQKESNKYTENNPKENEIYNLNDDDFKTAIIKILTELREILTDNSTSSGAMSQKSLIR